MHAHTIAARGKVGHHVVEYQSNSGVRPYADPKGFYPVTTTYTCVGDVKDLTKQLVTEVAAFVAYHESVGIDRYPASDELNKLLTHQSAQRLQFQVPPHPHRPERQDVTGPSSKQPQVQKVQETDDAPVASGADLKALGDEISRCHACSLSQSRTLPVPGKGGGRCRLLIVGDWLSVDSPERLPEHCQFGLEQDRMLNRMIDAIKMDRSEVFVTNVIKCGIPSSKQPKAEHVNTCLSFLQRQISMVRPRMILAMGLIAARALLGRPESLSRLRGRLLSYQGRDKTTIPLVATYHPTFLLQNEGMKKATWADLQLAAKQLIQTPGK